MKTFLARFAQDESGATAIEYGLIAAIIGVGIIAGLGPLKDALNGPFGTVNDRTQRKSRPYARSMGPPGAIAAGGLVVPSVPATRLGPHARAPSA